MIRSTPLVRTFAVRMILAGAALAVMLPGVASAQSLTGAEQRYMDYQFAVAVEETCTGTEFTQTQASKLEYRIDRLVGKDLSAGTSLNLISDAKEKLGELHSGGGCSDPKIEAARSVFETDLKSALD